MGYEAVRNETGKIIFSKGESLEESCYREISSIEILIGIVGGKFGSSAEKKPFSITQLEIKTAIEQNKQVYVFVLKNVLAEYNTYLLNKELKEIRYSAVDNIDIYSFLEGLHSMNNIVIHPFEEVTEITSFLKEQWAGLFRDFLIQSHERLMYANVSSRVDELTAVSTTLKTYLEEVLGNVTKDEDKTAELIQKQMARLAGFYKGKVVKDEDDNLYFIDKKGVYHLLPDEETAEFLESNEGEVDIKYFDLNRIFKEGNKFESVLNENAKLVWVDKTHIFIILDGKRFHVPSWDNLYSWKRTKKEDFIEISTDDLHIKYPDGK